MRKLAFIIQARMGSSRLPNKIVLPFFEEKNIFDLLIEKLQLNFSTINIILATSSKKENDILEKIALEKKISVYRGDENDVLNRFIQAAKQYDVDGIIRICSDNPFLSVNEIKRLIQYVLENPDLDYVSFSVNGKPSITTHYGFWTEYVSLRVLEKVKSVADDVKYREHVTNFIYENPSLFNIDLLKISPALEQNTGIRMTLDTKEDFLLLSEVYSKLPKENNGDIPIDAILQYLDEHPKYRNKMLEQIQRNKK